jgi:NAD(P)-dependent dehydrogenase (short-subunit alcohol dehydrogenase family)
MARWGIQDRVVTSALCCASYVVGMHLPGLSALFTILHLDFAEAAENFAYKATVTGFDERFSEMEADFSLTAGATVTASGTFSAMVRPPQPEPETLATSATTELAGRVAIVTGSSRGLGAAIQQAFERRGAQVFGVSRSQSMDAGNAVDMRVLRDRVTSESGRLDYLVCNAFPPLHSLRIEPETATRIQSYIDAAVALTLTPMAELLPLLHKSGGTLVMISSSAVETPVKEWPHYVAAKQAVEALATAAALQYSGVSTVIVRPPKLLTTLTNTPMGRLDAKSPAAFADSLVRHLVEPGKEKVTIYPRE